MGPNQLRGGTDKKGIILIKMFDTGFPLASVIPKKIHQARFGHCNLFVMWICNLGRGTKAIILSSPKSFGIKGLIRL